MMKAIYTIDKMGFELGLFEAGVVVRLAKIRDAAFGETEGTLGDIKGIGDLVAEEVPSCLISLSR